MREAVMWAQKRQEICVKKNFLKKLKTREEC